VAELDGLQAAVGAADARSVRWVLGRRWSRFPTCAANQRETREQDVDERSADEDERLRRDVPPHHGA